jgi:hypothetical protein
MSWGKGASHHCEPIYGFPQAQRYFEERGPVRSKRWTAGQRPLVSSTETWFRIDKENDDTYDLMLYDKKMIRYLRPQHNGSFTVLINYYGWKNKMNEFLRQMHKSTHHGYPGYVTTAGNSVMVPLTHDSSTYDKGSALSDWAAKLVFNKDGKLIVEESAHRTIYRYKSNATDRAKRKAVRENLAGLIDLLTLRLDTFHADSILTQGRSYAFGGMDSSFKTVELRTAVENASAGMQMPEEILDDLLPFAQEVYSVSLSRRVYNDEEETQHLAHGWNAETSGNIFDPQPKEVFRKALEGALIRAGRLDGASEKVALPLFMEKLPNKWY